MDRVASFRIAGCARLTLHMEHGVLQVDDADAPVARYLEALATRLGATRTALDDYELDVSDIVVYDTVSDAVFVSDAPFALLTPWERELRESCDAPSKAAKERALSYLVAAGNAASIEALQTTAHEAEKFALHACHARRHACLDVLLRRASPRPEMFDVCLRNSDWDSIRVLTAARYNPSAAQLGALADALHVALS